MDLAITEYTRLACWVDDIVYERAAATVYIPSPPLTPPCVAITEFFFYSSFLVTPSFHFLIYFFSFPSFLPPLLYYLVQVVGYYGQCDCT